MHCPARPPAVHSASAGCADTAERSRLCTRTQSARPRSRALVFARTAECEPAPRLPARGAAGVGRAAESPESRVAQNAESRLGQLGATRPTLGAAGRSFRDTRISRSLKATFRKHTMLGNTLQRQTAK